MPDSKDCVIMLSGGLDSTTALAMKLESGSHVYPVTFKYGQTHTREIESALNISKHYGIDLKIVTVDLSQITKSALMNSSAIEKRDLSVIGKDVPATYVPARNILFISIAASYAESLGINNIVYGANAVDYSGYPDCRPEFVNAMKRVLDIGTDMGNRKGFSLETPLQYLSKSEIITAGMRLHVPYELTWSCYRGEELACGSCDSCQLRLKGFREAGFRDPLKYQAYPEFYRSFIT